MCLHMIQETCLLHDICLGWPFVGRRHSLESLEVVANADSTIAGVVVCANGIPYILAFSI
jgi:hypothetical protein